ncbi:MAG TPA: ABC transporter substrate-binding protein [Xanthobacteraceae bacterium]
MKRRELIALLGATAAWPIATRAQQPAMPVVGYLNPSVALGYADELRSLRQGLKEGGYVEGENVTIEFRWAENEPDRLPALAAELIGRRVGVIIAASAPASVVATKATETIPIVFLVPEDPVRLGLVASLARPGGNATGVNFFAAELAAKRLELLRTLVPTMKRIAVLLNPAEPTIETANRRDVEAAAATMGLHLRLINAGSIAEIDAAFATLASDRPDALFISSGPFFANRSVQLAQLAARHAIPAIGGNRRYPEVGGLITYGASLSDAHRQAGIYIGRILKGAKPADLPVVQSTKFDLVINVSTARMLGISMPPALLATADQVIE